MLTVALLQMHSRRDDQCANRLKGEVFCRRAAAMGADIALFPEMWNIGYTYDRLAEVQTSDGHENPLADDLWRAPEYWADGPTSRFVQDREAIELYHAQAIARDSSFVAHFQALARELDIAIAITYLERWDPLPRNSMSLIDRHGEIVMTYAKVHTCDFALPECVLTPGDGFQVTRLDTSSGEVRVGAMICYDREFPESARILMIKGAELVLVPNASTLRPIHLDQFRLRAYENMMGVAMTNYAGSMKGHSIAYEPIAVAEGKPRDMVVVGAGEAEGIYLAPFDLEVMREYRRRNRYGNVYRRPQRYGELTMTDVAEPFVRVDADGTAYHETRRRV